jgi:hypothetical protein
MTDEMLAMLKLILQLIIIPLGFYLMFGYFGIGLWLIVVSFLVLSR